jgi:hypothetical protein
VVPDYLASRRQSCDESIQALINDPLFIGGAGKLLGAKVVRPQALVVNVMGPMRAITFRNEREAHAYDEHEDDLDVETTISRFRDDLTERGIDFTPPQDPFNDQASSTLLTQTYLVSAFV